MLKFLFLLIVIGITSIHCEASTLKRVKNIEFILPTSWEVSTISDSKFVAIKRKQNAEIVASMSCEYAFKKNAYIAFSSEIKKNGNINLHKMSVKALTSTVYNFKNVANISIQKTDHRYQNNLIYVLTPYLIELTNKIQLQFSLLTIVSNHSVYSITTYYTHGDIYAENDVLNILKSLNFL